MDELPVLRAVQLAKSFPAFGPRWNFGSASSSASRDIPGPASGLLLFHDLSLQANAGELVAIIGESGSGKSSLLHLLALLDRPSAGEIWFGSEEITHLRPEAAAKLRNREIGYVWQFHYLLPEFTAAENIALPLLARGATRAAALRSASEWLARVGLEGRADHRSGELSGGEQQRVSIARALITAPRLLLADEPTGDLDAATAERVFALLQQLTYEQGLATVLVTHNPAFSARCDRVLRLHAGALTPA